MGDATAFPVERPDGSFAAEDPDGGAIVLEFEEGDDGRVAGVAMLRGDGQRILWTREPGGS